MVKVSIIVPVYNVEKYIDRCLDSIFSQTLKDIEIILRDDESPDKCPQKCDEYAKKDPRVKVIHKKNGGLGFARNSGLEVATGEFVAFLDSDDFIHSAMYETLYNVAKKNDLDTCFCGFYYYYSENKIIPRCETETYIQFNGRNEVDDFFLNMVGPKFNYANEVKYYCTVWKAIYSNKIIKSNKLLFDSERLYVNEDLLFHSLYLPKAERVGFVPQTFYYYNNANNTSITSKYSEAKYQKILQGLTLLHQRLLTCYTDDKFKEHFYRYIFLTLRGILYNDIYKSGECTFREKYNRLRKHCSDIYFEDLYNHAPYKRLPFSKKILFSAIKNKNILLLMVIFFCKKKLT